MEFILIIVLLCQALIFGYFCSYIAKEKGRSGSDWFWLGFFFSFVAVLALIAVPNLRVASVPPRFAAKEVGLPIESRHVMSAPRLTNLVAEEIRKLGELRAEGLLTEAEFQLQKSHLLDNTLSSAITSQTSDPSKETVVDSMGAQHFGICTNCKVKIPMRSSKCPNCAVPFREDSIWSVHSI